MGWCHEFGVTVREGCSHPMTAGESSCQCDVCGFVCEGRFAGCSTVWERGPRAFVPVWPTQSVLGERERYLPPAEVFGGAGDEASVAGTASAFAPRPRRAGASGRTTRPDVKARAQEPNGDSEREADEATRWSPPATGASLPVSADEEARGRVFQWLHDSFEGLQAELRRLSEAVDRQQRGVTGLAGAGDAAGRLWDLADTLPRRIDQAVRDALGPQAAPAHPHPHQQEAGRATSSAGRGINRDGWQDKLRALRPAGSQPGG